MKVVEMYVTADGVVHDGYAKANRHAEARYGDALTKLAVTLMKYDKYSKLVPFLDENLDQFVKLKALKDDITLIASEDE